MAWWDELVRGIFAIPTGGLSEVVGRQNQLGRTATGGLEGGVGGFLTGGPIGAGMGAATGAGLSGTGTTNPYSLPGAGINVGSGAGAGRIGYLAGAPGGMFGGGGMTPYMPTSTPNMGMAGSTLGPGGMASPLNPMGPASMAGGPGIASQMLRAGRMMGGGQQPQQAPASSQADILAMLYKMMPNLRPGTSLSPETDRNELFALTGRY